MANRFAWALVLVGALVVDLSCGGAAPVAGMSCSDGVQNGSESDVDCGGGCAACDAGKGCLRARDCTTMSCLNNVCGRSGSCSDGTKNGDETDVDCGGSCASCADGKACLKRGDCSGGTCLNNACTALPGCVDGKKDGSETDVDCGGPVCGRCPDGKMCGAGDDCVNAYCLGGACHAKASCNDGLLDGSETDMDCGGPVCGKCGVDKKCGAASDCTSGTCTAGTCAAAATCNDGKKDGTESDVDCGGGCPVCGDGKQCLYAADCMIATCLNNVCRLPAACNNGMKDGGETDVDCGGVFCSRCADTKGCAVAGDCSSNLCSANVCQAAPTCNDGKKNGVETDVDCGGNVCPRCVAGKACLAASDCGDGICTANKCVAAGTCKDGIKNGQESDIDCGGAVCPVCGVSHLCVVNGDCLSGTCTKGQCAGGQALTMLFAPIAGVNDGSPDDLCVADFNNDGMRDLIVGAEGGVISVHKATRNGAWAAAVTFNAPGNANARRTLCADYNGDGKIDLAIGSAGTLFMYLGNGDMTFQKPIQIATGCDTAIARVVDMNGDGKLDLLLGNVANGQNGGFSFLKGDGAGNFGAAVASPALPPTSLVDLYTADIDKDGTLDVLAFNGGGSAKVTSLFGNGDGTFKLGKSGDTLSSWYSYPAIGDFDGDGTVDGLMFLATDNQYGAGSKLTFVSGIKDGSWHGSSDNPRTYWNTYGYTGGIAVGDLDLDGILDVVINHGVLFQPQLDSVFFGHGNGDGTFTSGWSTAAGNLDNTLPARLYIVDLNRDGKPDVVQVAQSAGVAMWLNVSY